MDDIKVKIDVIMGKKIMNNFMHACDMFENSKQLGEYEQMVVSGEPGMDMKNLTRNLKDALEQSGMNVVFVSIRQVGPTLTNDFDRYIMPGVSAITNGHNWGMFHKLLKGLGYEVETDQQMKVMSVKLAW